MCDIDSDVRRERYKILRRKGYLRGFAQRARDFTTKRYDLAVVRDMLDVEICNICNTGQKWQKGEK